MAVAKSIVHGEWHKNSTVQFGLEKNNQFQWIFSWYGLRINDVQSKIVKIQ